MAASPRAAQWFTAADGMRHPLIEISSDSSDDEAAAGGSRGALAPLDPATAQGVHPFSSKDMYGIVCAQCVHAVCMHSHAFTRQPTKSAVKNLY